MANNHTSVVVSVIPPCGFCGQPATIDGATRFGPWSNMCDVCFRSNGIGLGLGKGQRLILQVQSKEPENALGPVPNQTQIDAALVNLEDIRKCGCYSDGSFDEEHRVSIERAVVALGGEPADV